MTPRITAAILIALCAGATAQAQEYRSSVVGTDYDFIRDEDPSAFLCLEFKFKGWREMPDKSGDTPLVQEAFVFVSYYTDGTSVDMAIDADFKTQAAAKTEALRYVPRLGKLPTSLRRGVKRLVVHHGHPDTTAFSDNGLIVLYSANATKRIGTHDLEETVFHESVHASWDKPHARSKAWRDAQAKDGQFITHYGKRKPTREDLAESALFAYTLLHHPKRIPAKAGATIKAAIPNRIAFVKMLLPPSKPIFHKVGPVYAADGTGKTFTCPPPSAEDRAKAERIKRGKDAAKSCKPDLTRMGTLTDIVSNALMVGLKKPEADVNTFLDGHAFKTPDALLNAAAKTFKVDRKTLDAQVKAFRHCNCRHAK